MREGGKERRREGGKEGGREGVREGRREGGREGGRMRKKEGDKNFIKTKYYEMILHLQFFLCTHLKASQNLTKEASSLSTR